MNLDAAYMIPITSSPACVTTLSSRYQRCPTYASCRVLPTPTSIRPFLTDPLARPLLRSLTKCTFSMTCFMHERSERTMCHSQECPLHEGRGTDNFDSETWHRIEPHTMCRTTANCRPPVTGRPGIRTSDTLSNKRIMHLTAGRTCTIMAFWFAFFSGFDRIRTHLYVNKQAWDGKCNLQIQIYLTDRRMQL